jgi:hypothetical protein
MRSNGTDADLGIPEIRDFTGIRRALGPRIPGGNEIRIEGADENSLRLTPSNKVLGRFESTRDAWPRVLAEIERGVPARCLVLDWHGAEGNRGRVSAGRILAAIAESGIGRKPARSGRGRAAS